LSESKAAIDSYNRGPIRKTALMLARDESLGELLICASRGDEDAFARLYDQTSSRSYGLAIPILGDPQAAEEATLDAYEQVWRQAARYDHDKGNVINWILTTVRWKAIDQLRARNRRLNRDFRIDDNAGTEPRHKGELIQSLA
jgi:RNA polymerase sigma-70 factor (ECF subfamily)